MTERLILILEDDPMLGNIAVLAIKQLGFQIAIDREGNQYQRWLDPNNPPAAVVLDLHLPYVTGWEVLQQMRATPGLDKIPVVIVTADLQRGRQLEDQGERVLFKPVSVTRLQTVLKSIFPNPTENLQ